MLNGAYHSNLVGHEVPQRPRAKENISTGRNIIHPNNFGEHSSFILTARDCSDYLELRCTVSVSGSILNLDLYNLIVASYGVQQTMPCDHVPDTPLNSAFFDVVRTTSVASPLATDSKISIAQTYRNPVAQLLCCEIRCRTYLLRYSCLNCAIQNTISITRPDDGYPRIILI